MGVWIPGGVQYHSIVNVCFLSTWRSQRWLWNMNQYVVHVPERIEKGFKKGLRYKKYQTHQFLMKHAQFWSSAHIPGEEKKLHAQRWNHISRHLMLIQEKPINKPCDHLAVIVFLFYCFFVGFTAVHIEHKQSQCKLGIKDTTCASHPLLYKDDSPLKSSFWHNTSACSQPLPHYAEQQLWIKDSNRAHSNAKWWVRDKQKTNRCAFTLRFSEGTFAPWVWARPCQAHAEADSETLIKDWDWHEDKTQTC